MNTDLLNRIYAARKVTPSDINEHLELLSRLASLCSHVTEFGVRDGASTIGLLHGRPERLVSYDINPFGQLPQYQEAALAAGIDFTFHQANVLTLPEIATTDLLFIDTLHTRAQVSAELSLHAKSVNRYLVFHDTTTFGDHGEDGSEGLWPGIAEFLRHHSWWELQHYFTNNNGLTVLRRNSL